MAFSQTTPFRTAEPACAPVPSIVPARFCVGDNWLIKVALTDNAVASLSIAAPGTTPYTSVPSVVFPAPINGRTAKGHVSLDVNGFLTNPVIDDPGTGYDPRTPPVPALQGGAGGAGASLVCTVGNPRDLTGCIVSAGLFTSITASPTIIAGQFGTVSVLDAVHGLVAVDVFPALTGTVPPSSAAATIFPTRLSVVVSDVVGDKHTYSPIVILPLRPSDYALVPVQNDPQALFWYPSGPVAAGDSLTALQITQLISAASTSITNQLSAYVTTAQLSASLVGFVSPAQVSAQIAAAIAALPPPGASSAQVATIVANALIPYATSAAVSSALTSALAPYATSASVASSLASALAPYVTNTTVLAEIATALQPYLTSSQITLQINNAIAAATTSILATVSAMIASNNLTISALIDSKISNALSGYTPGGTIDDGSLSLDLGQSFNPMLN